MRRARGSIVCFAAVIACAPVAAVVVGCEPGLTDKRETPALDVAFFRCHVQPVLVRSCGALLCHGNQERFFRVFGRNRFRPLFGDKENRNRNTPLKDDEVQFNYDSAIAYVDASSPDESYLLAKPLDQKSGGFYHGGATEFAQGDVFLDRDDPGYKKIREWIAGAVEPDPDCKEAGAQ